VPINRECFLITTNSASESLANNLNSGLENAIKKHASPSSSATPVFSGKGQTLGGTPVAPDLVGEAKGALGPIAQVWSEMDPQFKIFLGLGALYFAFWYMG
jgi:thioredoxin 1